jgi:hypothetical protein
VRTCECTLVHSVRERTGMNVKSSRRFVVAVVDDDESVRESLPDLLRECGYAAEAFASAQEAGFWQARSDRMPRPRPRDARHVRTRAAPGAPAPGSARPDRLHPFRPSLPDARPPAGAELPGPGRVAARPHRARPPAASRRRPARPPHHLHHRARGRPHVGTGDEGGSGRVPDQALRRRSAASRHRRGHRTEPSRTEPESGAADAA